MTGRDMNDPAQITACGDEWAKVAEMIGCTLRGFDDDKSASFYTPDGHVMQVGPKFRAVIEAGSVVAPPSGVRNVTGEPDEGRALRLALHRAGRVICDALPSGSGVAPIAIAEALDRSIVEVAALVDAARAAGAER